MPERHEPCNNLAPVTLARWHTVRLGVHKTPEEYVGALEAKGIRMAAYARRILAKIEIAAEEDELELFLGSARDFGFTWCVSRRRIFERAAAHGYHPCPAETGPATLDQYADRRLARRRHVVAMEPISDFDQFEMFVLGRYDREFWLNSCTGHSGLPWRSSVAWVWCRRKP